VRVIGEEKANELRTLRETGASPEKLEEKANAAIAAMEAPQLKQLAKEFGPTCRNILLRGQQPERARRQAAVADDGDDDCED
jgi:hypothetical protein